MANRGNTSQQLTNVLDKLRENEENLLALLHVLPVGVSILGENRKPVYTNIALEKILGLSRDELYTGKYEQREYLRSDGSSMPAGEFPSTRAFEEKRAIEDVEIGIVVENGKTVWTMVNAVPFKRGDWRVLLTVSDVTYQKKAENALQTRTHELVERVKELNCLYSIADLVEQPEISLEEILQGTVELIPPSWHYPDLTSARILYEEREYGTREFKTSDWKQAAVLYVHGHPGGSIEVYYTGDLEEGEESPFLQEEENLLLAIAERLGRIVERFRAEQLLLKLATTDPLTELYNRRHYFELAEREVERSRRYGHPLACIMFDIDYFKRINDSYGHLFGDRVLKEMVRCCRKNIRKVDIFARYGGDEFVILLPETGLNRSKQLAVRLCSDFQNNPLKIDEREISISLSLGLASMQGNENLALDTLLNRADEALYGAKKKGRNQVFVWEKTE
jgi:diguanylate cyclase (GGDEF)-like protein/PAS domain S-box-containing protein